MGRWVYGLAFSAALAAGCAAAATPDELSQHVGDNSDLAGIDLAGGMVVDNCMAGQSCSTSNPGACAMGTTFCSGNVQSCVPSATTQSCYDGPAATKGVGACKAGTQTCIGALGSCDGQVKPATLENCFNDIDDDCDGVVNNGCPDHLVTGTAHLLTARGSTAHTAYSLRCPANTFVSKSIVYGDDTDQTIGGIDLFCATPTLVRGTSSYSVTEAVNATAITRHAGNITTGKNFTFDCGAAFSPAFFVNGQDEAGAIDAIGHSCASAAINFGADNKLTFTFTKQTSLGAAGYLAFGTAYEDDCAAGEVLIGFDGHSGNWMDGMQAICAPLQVVYK